MKDIHPFDIRSRILMFVAPIILLVTLFDHIEFSIVVYFDKAPSFKVIIILGRCRRLICS
jgi:hypothetical protein